MQKRALGCGGNPAYGPGRGGISDHVRGPSQRLDATLEIGTKKREIERSKTKCFRGFNNKTSVGVYTEGV